MSNWHQRLIELAAHVATWSKDPSSKIGAVVVGPDHEIRSSGFNGLARGIADTEERLNNRELKYKLIVHAELNALLNAALIGVSTKGCDLYCSGLPPCLNCAKAIIQAGIVVVWIRDTPPVPERWADECKEAEALLIEAGVQVRRV